MKIQPVLDSCEMQMEHHRSTQLRSENLLSLLKVERENIKNNNLLNKNFTAVEMSSDMDKNELRHELNYAIILLSDYQKSQSLSIALPSNAYSRISTNSIASDKQPYSVEQRRTVSVKKGLGLVNLKTNNFTN
jgi:hypothetical protein